jgi:hypothetical protein
MALERTQGVLVIAAGAVLLVGVAIWWSVKRATAG